MASFPPIKITLAAVDRISGVFRKIEGRTSGLRSKLAAFGAHAARIGSILGGLGLAAAYAGKRLFTGFLDRASAIKDTSAQLGITAERYQEIIYSAEEFGVTQNEVAVALRKLVAEGGNADTFLTDYADKFSRITTLENQSIVAKKHLGRAGQKLIPLLTQESRVRAQTVKQLYAMSRIRTTQQVDDADKLGDNIGKLKGAFVGLGDTLAVHFMPKISEAVEGMTAFLEVSENREKVMTFFTELAATMKVIAGFASVVGSVFGFAYRGTQGFGNLVSKAVTAPMHIRSDSAVFKQAVFDAEIRRAQVRDREVRIILEAGADTRARLAPGSRLPPGSMIKSHMGPSGVGFGGSG